MLSNQKLILTQDIGINSCKAALFSTDGTMLKSNTISYRPEANEHRWSQQSPALWWNAFLQNCRTLLMGVDPKVVKAVSVCGQMMGCLALDDRMEPLHDHITWDDMRATAEIKQIEQSIDGATFYNTTGLCFGHGFTLPLILWLRNNKPKIYEKTSKISSCKDYVNYLLTGRVATDETYASFTQLYDIFNRCWAERILNMFQIRKRLLPDIVPYGSVLGNLTASAAVQCGLTQDTVVVEAMGDGRMPALGAGVLRAGDTYINLGSSSWISQATDSPVMAGKQSLTKSLYHSNLFVNGGASLAGRLCLDWYINTFETRGALADPADLSRFVSYQLANSPIGSNGLLFLPYLRGARSPYWNNSAKGGFIGLNINHTKYDFFRSILEGVSFQLVGIKNRISELDEPIRKARLVGSAAFPEWQQILSDVLEVEITAPDISAFAGCVGAALLAGMAIGEYRDYSEVYRFHHSQRITSPINANVNVYREIVPAFEDCYYALADINRYISYQ